MESSLETESDFEGYVQRVIQKQRAFYRSGATHPFAFRKKQLLKLRDIIREHEDEISEAVRKDLHRSEFVMDFAVGGVLGEINYYLELTLKVRPPFVTRRLKKWMEPVNKPSPLLFLGSKAKIQQVPKGVTLIIGPWNYPFLLTMVPLIGAIAGGNTAVIKPSEISENTSKLLKKLINENFPEEYVHVIEGGIEESKILVDQPEWDHIFFTGSTEVGRKVYLVAAKHLTPVTLELGGKSPAIVDRNVHLDLAARRIIQGKYTNVGQTCMAPDYILVHEEVKPQLVEKLEFYINRFYGEDPKSHPDYARIINERNFNRLKPYIESSGKLVHGGESSPEDCYIAPTLIDNVSFEDGVMKEEIFGPLLPIVTWNDPKQVIDYIENNPPPLSLYIYTKDKKFKDFILQNTTFGGAMINDSVLHYLHPEVPFGGVRESGIGNYTGKYTFDTFTQTRPVIEAGRFLDRLSEKLGIKFFRYPPYNSLKRKLLKLVHRTLSRVRI